MLLVGVLTTGTASGAALLARWNLNEPVSPYAGSGVSAPQMEHDADTAPPATGAGYEGGAVRLLFNASAGGSTRLVAEGDILKADSFGFSIWIRPVDLKAGDSIIAKEIPTTTGEGFARMGWQLCIGQSDGSGTAPLELIVRGGDRINGDFFGSVLSAVKFPLSAASGTWFHVAGGYDAVTGQLSLVVNGVAASSQGSPGAVNSQLGRLSIGSVRNGEDLVAYAALAYLDDLRIYDGPLAAAEIEALMASPDPSPPLLAWWKFGEQAPPYADSGGRGIELILDEETSLPLSGIGINGPAVRLHYDGGVGVSTRLSANSEVLQTDSFGFSFWINPVSINPRDNLLAKQMAAQEGEPATRVAWQVRLGEDNGAGESRVEFVVRGSNRAQEVEFGKAVSSVPIPLQAGSAKWYHIAGGYDSASGRLALYVNGVETLVEGIPGAYCSDGSPLDVGTVRNGGGFVAYSASTLFDDLQIYGALLNAKDVATLLGSPGISVSSSMRPRFPANLIAHWSFDEPQQPYRSEEGSALSLQQDFVTAVAPKVTGVSGDGLQLRWDEAAGISTRLFSSDASLQRNTFGFSFWLRPTWLSPFESIISKETSPTGGADFAKVSWQVQVGEDDGSGMAPLQFIVRGSDRSQTSFFGAVLSGVVLPLRSNMSEWIHVAGGYDADTGALSLIVNGVEAWVQGRPGANNSDGSWLSVGSVRNGIDFVGYSAIADIDELQIFDGPVSLYEEACLRKFPGLRLTKRFAVTSLERRHGDVHEITFNSVNGWYYYIDASTDLATYKPVSLVVGKGETTTIAVSKAMLDAALGGAERPKLFFRVRAVLEDPFTLSLGLPPATILPFYNSEMYVPQYHFSFEHANVGDPNGVIRYQGKYHIFTWDHAVSTNLLTWSPVGWPMRDISEDAGFWTGSVVVDLENTSGFGLPGGLPPMVAIYTIHDNTTHQESVGIAYSTDHLNFYNFTGNPVVEQTGELTFRDPDVFWDAARNRWFMAVARSEKQAVAFYSSDDLKAWEPVGLFNADFANDLNGNRATRVGARNEIWEVPGMVEVPIRGGGNQKKWLLFVGAGTDKVQYYIGDFDGSKFTIDPATWNYLRYGTGLEGEVFADFEQDHWNGWTPAGDAFGWEPVPFWWNRPAFGYLGDRLASTYSHDPSYAPGIQDFRTGSLISPPFLVSRNCINFLIGGGNHPDLTCINLVVDGQVVRSTTGDNSDSLKWAGWDVSEFKGRAAHIEIVDHETGEWGRIYVDQIMFSDVLTDTGKEHANWVDCGSDFFAPKVVRDYDGVETDVRWIAWIGSWLYEQDRPNPETWGKGAQTIFRKLQLAASPKGYQLVQQPDQGLQLLRGPVVNVTPRTVNETETLAEFQPQTNTYEIEVEFDLAAVTGNQFGVNLCVQEDWPQRVVVGYDRLASNLYLDRTSSGFVTFGPGFQSVVRAPYKPAGNVLGLRIFVDQSSIEVFTKDGERVMTSQIYPHTGGTKVQLFSSGGSAALKRMRGWVLRSIW
ncbi:MAG: GH32 C-terminal domain-containing protein [Chthoniobacterales bacterium]|nr:GH32 C-terminal domain-containing protein [Chthoniobacterales bacterium]